MMTHIQHGASEDQAFKSWLLNAGIGTTEILTRRGNFGPLG
jgi:hypothetical protein